MLIIEETKGEHCSTECSDEYYKPNLQIRAYRCRTHSPRASSDWLVTQLMMRRATIEGTSHWCGWLPLCFRLVCHYHSCDGLCVCRDETGEAVDLALQSLAHAQTTSWPHIADLVLEWFWDGKVQAMQVLSKHCPNAIGHLCLEHAKCNTEKRYTGGYKKVTRNFIEISAFLTPYVSTCLSTCSWKLCQTMGRTSDT